MDNFIKDLFIHSVEVTTDLTGKQFLIVGANGAPITTAGAAAFGVLQNEPVGATGKPKTAIIGYLGITKVMAGGTFNAGVPIASDANGKAVAAGAGANVIGHSLSAGAAGKLATIFVCPTVGKV